MALDPLVEIRAAGQGRGQVDLQQPGVQLIVNHNVKAK